MKPSTAIAATLLATTALAQFAFAAPASRRDAPKRPRISLDSRGGIHSFTPANVDPRLAAALARSSLSNSGFRFTPSAAYRLNRSVTVAVRAGSEGGTRTSANDRSALVAPAASSIAPIAYNLGAALGWKRFALQGDVARVDSVMGGRRNVDVGVSYGAPRWTARVAASADAPTAGAVAGINAGRGYSLDVGGSYALSRSLNVTAGVRYRSAQTDPQRLPIDDARDSQAVYVGTAFKF